MTINWRTRAAKAAIGAAMTVAAVASTVAATSGPASAVGALYVPQQTAMLACPYVGPCAVVYTVQAGTYVTGLCWTDAGWSYGTNRWFQAVVYKHVEIVGYISANRVAHPQPQLQHCP